MNYIRSIMPGTSGDIYYGANGKLFEYARKNRRRPTKAEKIVWTKVRDRKFHGVKFRRQHPVLDFIADFFCAECKLIIEIDGDYHEDVSQSQYDEGRTYELAELGIKILRFTNDAVIHRTTQVFIEILNHLTLDEKCN